MQGKEHKAIRTDMTGAGGRGGVKSEVRNVGQGFGKEREKERGTKLKYSAGMVPGFRNQMLKAATLNQCIRAQVTMGWQEVPDADIYTKNLKAIPEKVCSLTQRTLSCGVGEKRREWMNVSDLVVCDDLLK